MRIFDYIYCRIYFILTKKEIGTPDERATILVSLFQVLIILDVCALLQIKIGILPKLVVTAFLLIIFGLNLKRFKNLDPSYLEKIKDEDERLKSRNGIIIICSCIFILGAFLIHAASISFFD